MSIRVDLNMSRGDFSFAAKTELPGQGITAIFGPSGSGKTTLLRGIIGLDKHSGLVKVNEQLWQDNGFFLPVHKRRVGVVFQEASLFPHLSVQANIDYGAKRAGVARHENAEMIELLDLAPLLSRKTENLSGGERQRVAIARALAMRPQILVMDEPLASLDRARKSSMMPYLKRLHANLTIPILYVTHSINEIAALADHVLQLEKGKIITLSDVSSFLVRDDAFTGHSEDICVVIDTTIRHHDDTFSLSEVALGKHVLYLPRQIANVGESVRVQIAARDVSLALDDSSNSSILNRLPAKVLDIVEESTATNLVKLQIDEHILLARITAKSKSLLNLQIGQTVYAQIKSVAVL